jgi:hypothetical protein
MAPPFIYMTRLSTSGVELYTSTLSKLLSNYYLSATPTYPVILFMPPGSLLSTLLAIFCSYPLSKRGVMLLHHI